MLLGSFTFLDEPAHPVVKMLLRGLDVDYGLTTEVVTVLDDFGSVSEPIYAYVDLGAL